MAHKSDLIEQDINQYLKAHQHKELLRFMTCGSVDDGKSTLIGRLLFESKMLFEDQLQAIEADSKKYGTQGKALDFALLVDGLASEREQGITIDVAYRFFSTENRKFIVADTPGHEQYTRNMITGASTADVAILLIDARKGVLTQTKRHCYLMHLVGIKKIIVAINKMDLINYSETRYQEINQEFSQFAQQLGLTELIFIPISAFIGDNITKASDHMPWYQGPALMQHLEQIPINAQRLEQQAFRLPVQWVNRPNSSFRGFAGTLASGCIQPGDPIRVLPSGQISKVKSIYTLDKDLTQAVAGQSITLVLEDEIDIARGDVISQADAPLETAHQFEASLVWMHEEPLLPGRPYMIKIGTQTVLGSVTSIKYQINPNTLEQLAASQLELNAIAVCNISFSKAIPFEPYAINPDLGGFILIDRLSHATVGAGMLHFALRRSHNIHQQAYALNKAARAAIKHQKPTVIWLTGLSGSGKSTLANLVEQKLYEQGRHTYLLDGDNIRHGLNQDLGFKDADRVENIRRIAEVSKLMVDAGLIVITAFISPFTSERQLARSLFEADEFIEVFVDVPLEIAEQRDPKGLYQKARRGDLKNFTGIDSQYQIPDNPELHLKTAELEAEEAAALIMDYLYEKEVLLH